MKLATAALHLNRPIRFMLATPVADSAEVMKRVGDEAWIEDKYDGIRAQLHLQDGTPRLFSRDQNDITISFPEVAAAAGTLGHALVIDGELVPYRAGSVMDFASLQTRLGRVNPGKELLEQVPVVLVAFDLLHLDGRWLLSLSLDKRREALRRVLRPGDEVVMVPAITGEGRALHAAVSAQGIGGVLARRRSSPYLPGVRSRLWRSILAGPAGESPAPPSDDSTPSDVDDGTAPVLALFRRLPFDDE